MTSKIFILIPVFNRLHHTKRVIEALRDQTVAKDISIVVIDDGSTDGTGDFLSTQSEITTLLGDGSLWWGGAIDLGLRYVLPNAGANDYVLFINNDTWFESNYIDTLVRVSREEGCAAVGSVIHEENRDDPLVSIGPRININRIAVWDLLAELPDEERRAPKAVYRVDALSGRGTLYPVALFRTHGGMRPNLLPHYMADYEIAMRFARDGNTPLLVSSKAVVFSPPVYGNDVAHLSWWERHFSKRSSSNVFYRLAFYSMIGSPLQRFTAPLRLTIFGISRSLQQIFKRFTSVT